MPRVAGQDVPLGWLAIGAIGLVVFGPWLARRLTETVAESIVSIPIKSAEGLVIGIGKALGIPETNAAQCELAMREGRTLDASFYCPAGEFLVTAAGQVVDVVKGAVVGFVPGAGVAQFLSVQWDQAALASYADEWGGGVYGEPVSYGNIADYPAA